MEWEMTIRYDVTGHTNGHHGYCSDEECEVFKSEFDWKDLKEFIKECPRAPIVEDSVAHDWFHEPIADIKKDLAQKAGWARNQFPTYPYTCLLSSTRENEDISPHSSNIQLTNFSIEKIKYSRKR